MPAPNTAALAFLQSRRSRPAKTLTTPVPDDDDLRALLTIAARTPDHGKLEPWRFIVLQRPALLRLAAEVEKFVSARTDDTAIIAKQTAQYANAHLAIAVVESPKPSPKIPPLEQTYSAGAVCLALLNGALASGWGANWLSGPASHDAGFTQTHLGLAPHERIAGLIHLGTETNPPPERPRPDVDSITTWVAS
ncbi:MAG: nitroreductase [Nereida ignava]|uniref:nitroreductase family protein n=1 Tax=Nereida ignava TaxID=282199 RepID=UPI0030F7927B